jgi:hypothetical protein
MIRGLIPSWREGFFSKMFRLALGPNEPPIQRVLGTKQPVCKFDDSPPFSAEAENKRSYISTPSKCLPSVERKKFAFYIYFIILVVVTTNNLNNKFNKIN